MSDILSDREQQVAAMLAAGLRVNAAAEELCISPVTVRNHLRNIFAKVGVHSQSELIRRIERDPGLLGPHRRISGVGSSTLVDDLGEADAALRERLEKAFATKRGLEAMKAAMRVALPLDDLRRREWRARLGAHAVGDQQREVRDAAGETRRGWAQRPLLRISSLQRDGWLQPDLDPEEVRRRLFAAIYGAAVALLADPSEEEQERQLATIDELLVSMARDDGSD